MMPKEKNVFSSIEDFDKRFPNSPKEGERRQAIENYFKYKGVVRAYTSDKEWPKLIYPNYTILTKKIDEIKTKRNLFQKNYDGWKKKYNQAKNYDNTNQLKKLKDPLFWKHKTKMIIDSDYRADVNSVKLPVHLVGDPKWKPMVKMFINDLDYRKQLTETVTTSIIYKKDKKVAKYADELKDFRMQTTDKQVQSLELKISKLNDLDKSLKELIKWAKE